MMRKRKRRGVVRAASRRRLALEPLESRVVLAGESGIEIVQAADAVDGFEKFESADELRSHLLEAARERWQDLFGTTITRWPYETYYLRDAVATDVAADVLGPNVSGVAGSSDESWFDGTNIQVRGVDEADLVKTDGAHLYVANEGRLSIIDARNPADLSLTAEISLDAYAAELYVQGDRLMVLSNQFDWLPYRVLDGPGFWYPGEDFGPETSVAIYDISDRSSPSLIQQTTFDGTLTTSRRIDNFVYLVTSDDLRLPRPELHCEAADPGEPDNAAIGIALPGDASGWARPMADALLIHPQPWPGGPRESCVYETEQAYIAWIEARLLELALPSFETVDSSGNVLASGLLAQPGDTYKPLSADASRVTSIVVFDLSSAAAEPAGSTSVLSSYGSTVYVAPQHIYLASDTYEGDGQSRTTLQQFSLGNDGTSVELAAVASIPGTLLNQFSIDEHDGYVRVVTTTGWGGDRTNQLFVLQQTETSLEVVGTIDEIATGETVFAVRFVGDEAFVVTFRVIDPLFTIDLRDPTRPVIAGELKIPGFSNYLHPTSEDLVLGLGRDDGAFGSAPQLSLFDVSDFGLPKRVDKLLFEDAAWSEAFHNHHAISYFPDSQIAVVPFQAAFGLCFDVSEIRRCDPQSQNAFWVVQVDTTSTDPSLQLLGKIEHSDALLRSLRIDEHLFTISASTVKVTELRNPETLIDQLTYGRFAQPDYVTIDVTLDTQDRAVEIDVLGNDHVTADARIVEVDVSATEGVVDLLPDGKTLLYTPATGSESFSDSFEYTVESAGRRDTTMVQVHIQRETVEDRMVRLATADLLARLGPEASPDDVYLRGVTEQEWPDSCLGVGDEGLVCAQVVTPGFRIVLEYFDTRFVYHTDKTQRVVAANDPVVSQDHLLQLRPEITNARGAVVTSLIAGEEATLKIYAEDLRAEPQGVFAAYFDVLFDPAQVAQFGPIEHSVEFENGKSGVIDDAGIVDEVGGFDELATPDRTLVVSIPFVAAGAGDLRFVLEAADQFPVHDVLLLGLDNPVPQHRIQYGEMSVEVVESLHNDADPRDTNMDGQMTPLDALVVMNHLNRHGAGPVNATAVRAARFAADEARAVRFALDVNRDNFISPIDMLLIINALDAGRGRAGEGEADPKPATPTYAVFEMPAAATRQSAASARTSKTFAAPDRFPANDDINGAAVANVRFTTPVAGRASGDRFFAELALDAEDDWWERSSSAGLWPEPA